jgi:murein hydrolase activator
LPLDPFLHPLTVMHSETTQSSVGFRPIFVAMVGILPFGMTMALAQTPPRPPGAIPYLSTPAAESAAPPANPPAPPAAVPADPKGRPNLETIHQRDQELEALRSQQRKALESEAKLKREVESIGDDRRKLNQQLIDAAARVRAVEEEVAKTEDHLKPLDAREQALRKSLDARREVIGEVLAALQRIGRYPPTALMVRPEDALQSVRSAILLGAVLPEMRHEAEVLAGELAELIKVRKEIATERERFDRDLAALAAERPRLLALVEQRQKQQADTEKALTAERQRALQLARQADDLKDLIVRLEKSLDKATLAARNADRPHDEAPDVNVRPGLAALKDPGRLTPAVAFASAKRLLPLPVNGVRIKDYGAPDGVGGSEKGLSIAARSGAQITSPCDGWVVYAGPFRNYGQLLILNAGGGYHVLLAGMDRISVDLGQFVVTGEPVAVMGGGAQAAAALAIGSGQPILYVEFRKDGTPVDPGPWWAASEGEKVRG